MDNMFENAYFGKAYKTRDDRKAIFYYHHNAYARERANYVAMILEGEKSIYRWFYNGEAADKRDYLDIVSEWQEPLNEEELDKLDDLVYDYNEERQPNYWWEDDCTVCVCEASEVREAYKAGYKAAKKGE